MNKFILILIAVLSASSLPAREPVWIFNNGPDAKLLAIAQGQLHLDGELTKLTPTGSDLSLSVPMGADDAFSADERPFFAVRYKYDTSLTQAGLFFTTDTLTVLSDKSYSAFPVVGDKTWRNAIIDMRQFDHKNWRGTITSFRFDPTNPSDTHSSYQLSRLGFFPSEEEAKNFLEAAIDSPYTNEYLTRDRIRIGAWVSPNPQAVGEDFIKTYRSGGFDWIIAHGALGSPENRDMLLRECDNYGVELILGDGAYTNPAIATAEYFEHPCFAGTYITDEPGTDEYDSLAEICNRYYQETDGKIPYINLLPMYANAAQLKYGASAAAIEYYDADPALFKKYCDSFCEKFDAPYICTDIYPLNWAAGKRTTYADYCESINVIATSAREHSKDFWCCIQTFAWVPSKRTPTESEFRWQSYCMLSFGCKGLLCWTYAGYTPEFPSLVTIEGKRTNAWYDAAIVFKEMHNISDAFVQYKNIGALAHNCTDATPYLKFSNPLASFATIEHIACDDPLLVGCFEKKDGPGTAFTIVNMSELEEVKTTHVKLKLAGSTAVAWPRGERVELTRDSDGFCHLTLEPGEGVFVEVE